MTRAPRRPGPAVATLAAVAALALAAATACDDSPRWTTPLQHLDRMVLSAWGDGPGNVYFAGGSVVGPGASLALHYDGARFTELHPPAAATLWWVFAPAAAPRDVWFVGEGGTVLRYDGATFTAVPSGTTETLYGVWGASSSDLWVVGGKPDRSSVALHFDGTRFAPETRLPDNAGAWFKVWGSGPSDVFVVGQHGAIQRFDGAGWSALASGVGVNVSLLTVAGRAPDDVYIVGGVGRSVALHYDGKSVTPLAGLDLDLTSGLTGVSVSRRGDLAIVGLAGALFRRPAGGAFVDDSRVPTTLDFHGAWLDGPGDVYAVGGNLNAPAGVPREGIVAHFGR